MPPRLSWSNLLPGLIALALIALIVVGVLTFAGVGETRGETVRLYVIAEQARGVMAGTEVWLFGQKIGVVEKIDFRAPSADTTGRVVLAIDVLEADARTIKRDAPASVRAGANIIGPVVVYIGAGDPSSPSVRSGDTLRAPMQTDFAVATEKLTAAATSQVPALKADVSTIMSHIRDGRGTLGALMSGEAGDEAGRLRANVSRLRGTKVSTNMGEPMRAAKSALARVDSIRTLLGSNRSSFGRYRRDSTLARSIAAVRDELTGLRAVLDTSDGTLQRWRSDSAIIRSITDAQREMTLLFDDVRRRPMRYIQF